MISSLPGSRLGWGAQDCVTRSFSGCVYCLAFGFRRCFGSHCRKCSRVHSRWPSNPEGNCLEEERAKSGGESGVFSGIRGGCELEVELRLKDVLSEKREWESLVE